MPDRNDPNLGIESSDFFGTAFTGLTGNPPFPWQRALYRRLTTNDPPQTANLPTGLGKTNVVAVWLIALATHPQSVPRRLVYVVNRRTVVDQSTRIAERFRKRLADPPPESVLVTLAARLADLAAIRADGPLAISTLRGQFADNGEWWKDPARPAVIVGTIDMIGSRVLFGGYRAGFKSRPLFAGFLGQDALLVHDEAHLEPAFQELLVKIRREQSGRDFRPLRVLELTATARRTLSDGLDPIEATAADEPLTLSDEDYANDLVDRRVNARKTISFHYRKGGSPGGDKGTDLASENDVAVRIGELAEGYKDSGAPVLIFVRTLDSVSVVQKAVERTKRPFLTLTGTMRGLERDELVRKPVFLRFLPPPAPDDPPRKAEPELGTVYLICTAAGEVGVDISADHLICDLTPFDSMAQRFGRVNRYGTGNARIDVVHEAKPNEKKKVDPLDRRRWLTLALLKELDADASPAALGRLDSTRREEAFTPSPTILPTSDILFDAWALTSVCKALTGKRDMPGRPPLAEYLHGAEDDQQAETHVGWRTEVWHLRKAGLTNQRITQLLDEYPLKPHELLRDSTYRKNTGVRDQLVKLAAGQEHLPVWLQDSGGDVRATTLGEAAALELDGLTVVLPPEAGGLAVADGNSKGMLDGEARYDAASRAAYDVADVLTDDHGQPFRWHGRTVDMTEPPVGMRRVVPAVPLRPESESEADEESAEEADGNETGFTHFQFFVRPRAADDEGSKIARKPVRWEVHTEDVRSNTERIVAALRLPPDIQTALVLAARYHDLGKRRIVWQKSIGNPNPQEWYGKSGGRWKAREITDYRHEFGSLLDVLNGRQEHTAELARQTEDVRDLVLHLIAAHHGRGRPHFPSDEAFDPEPQGHDEATLAGGVLRRFARLQREYGRWGLAYLESLLRAADIAASVNPSQEEPS